VGRRKIYIEEFDCFGDEIDVSVKCNNWDAFLKVWDIETLNRLLKTSVAQENYEMAELIKKHIELKGGSTNVL
jgi:hypothetical protein